MSFDSHSLERLRKLGRKLPQEIKPSTPNQNKTINSSLNSNANAKEEQQDPDKLFHELIQTSTDGNIPNHLINKLKESESRAKEKRYNIEAEKNQNTNNGKMKDNIKALNQSKNDYNELYIQFKQLLLEDDI